MTIKHIDNDVVLVGLISSDLSEINLYQMILLNGIKDLDSTLHKISSLKREPADILMHDEYIFIENIDFYEDGKILMCYDKSGKVYSVNLEQENQNFTLNFDFKIEDDHENVFFNKDKIVSQKINSKRNNSYKINSIDGKKEFDLVLELIEKIVGLTAEESNPIIFDKFTQEIYSMENLENEKNKIMLYKMPIKSNESLIEYCNFDDQEY
ncbi:MAG: hypothetical protein MHPSP_001672, partial [Paramarteilia canceri]